ncbi:hypothetical protein AAMO2058_000785500 [Amorphochlora amoebiformis]
MAARWSNACIGAAFLAFTVTFLGFFSSSLSRRVGSTRVMTRARVRASSLFPRRLRAQATTERNLFVAGNWKMNPNSLEAAESLSSLVKVASTSLKRDRSDLPSVKVGVVPPYPFIGSVSRILQGSGVLIGAQDLHWEANGAFTGGISASMLKSMGVDFVLCGHSERRAVFGDTDKDVGKKVKAGLKGGLDIVLCVGETLDEYQNDLVESICSLQLAHALSGVSIRDAVERLTIAYEPVWAIGTGLTATPQQAQHAHQAIRSWLSKRFGEDAARCIPIQYGGSVTPETAPDLLAMPDIDGALVGGASLVADKFQSIFTAAASEAARCQSMKNFSENSQKVLGASPLDYWDAVEMVRELSTKAEDIQNELHHAKRDLERFQEVRQLEKTVTYIKAKKSVPCSNDLGESPVWSQRYERLFWVDITGKKVWSWSPDGGSESAVSLNLPSMVGCTAITDKGGLILALEDGFHRFHLSTGIMHKMTDWPESKMYGLDTRPNDGRVDRSGNLVVGSYNFGHRKDGKELGSVYRLSSTPSGGASLEPLKGAPMHRVSNCISFSPDGETMYFCDTPTKRIFKYNYDPETGTLSDQTLFYEMPPEMLGMPDGANVDAQGGLWVAMSGGGRVVRIDNSGNLDVVVEIPVKSPTSVTIGGASLDMLYITTRGPDGGQIYEAKLPTGIHGLPETEFDDWEGSTDPEGSYKFEGEGISSFLSACEEKVPRLESTSQSMSSISSTSASKITTNVVTGSGRDVRTANAISSE